MWKVSLKVWFVFDLLKQMSKKELNSPVISFVCRNTTLCEVNQCVLECVLTLELDIDLPPAKLLQAVKVIIIILLILEVVKNTPRIFFDFALNIFHFKPKIVIIKEFYVVNKVLNKIERFHTFKKSYDCPWIRFGG